MKRRASNTSYASAFTGNDSPDIDEWLADFELNSITVGWTSFNGLIYARQLVKGATTSNI